MDSIPFLVSLPEEAAGNDQLGIFSIDSSVAMRQISVDVLKDNLASVTLSMLNVLEDIKQVGKFKLKEVTLNVEVSANGGVSLIGTANVGGKGAISLKFSE